MIPGLAGRRDSASTTLLVTRRHSLPRSPHQSGAVDVPTPAADHLVTVPYFQSQLPRSLHRRSAVAPWLLDQKIVTLAPPACFYKFDRRIAIPQKYGILIGRKLIVFFVVDKAIADRN